jgi:CTP synthase
VPYFGICFGMQMAVHRGGANAGRHRDAGSDRVRPDARAVVGLMTEWMRATKLEKRKAGGDLGGTMRLGAYRACWPGSRVAEIYGTPRSPSATATATRSTCATASGWRRRAEFSGMSPDGLLPEIVDDQLADQAVVVGRDAVALIDAESTGRRARRAVIIA